MGVFKKRMKDPVRGTAQVVGCNMPDINAKYNQGKLELVVSAEGVQATSVTHKGFFPVKRWPMPGQTLPITLDRANPERIEIHFDEVPSGQQQAEQQARQLAALMNAQQGPAGATTPNVPAGLSEDQAERVQQVLGSLGSGGLGSAQVVDLQRQAGAGAGAPDPVDRLQKLDQLRQSGALTDAEFEQQKKRILGET